MGRKSPRTLVQEKPEIRSDVKFSFVSRLSSHGKSFYLRVPKDEISFFNLEAGDRLHASVDSAKILRPTAETHPQ